MTTAADLHKRLLETLGRAHCVLCGRGTTALWLALRAIRRRDGPGEVILPDILCQTALDGVLLAGFRPVFAEVLPGRLTLAANRLASLITPHTRAILVAHLFGHVADLDQIRQAAPGIPLIEDAVQGFGGFYRDKPVGSWGDLSFISFDRHKMIGGRGGALLFDDDSLREAIESDLCKLTNPENILVDNLNDSNGFYGNFSPAESEQLFGSIQTILCKLPNRVSSNRVRVAPLLPSEAAAVFTFQLKKATPTLLCQFNATVPNVERILTDWDTLNERVAARNWKAHLLQGRLANYPLLQPEIRVGDAIWRYTLTFLTATAERRVRRSLQLAGINGSAMYYPLSALFGQQTGSDILANRLINLFVDESTDEASLNRAADVIAALPWSRLNRR
jgi:dTDP-4-amino-4,6-dideoxygalactose transaminase